MYEINTEDVYKDISGDVTKRFDTSDYPKEHQSGIPTGVNKNVLGMFKDENKGKQISGFVGLRPMLYAIKMDDGWEEKKCKGINKSVIKKTISFGDYKDCLFLWKKAR